MKSFNELELKFKEYISISNIVKQRRFIEAEIEAFFATAVNNDFNFTKIILLHREEGTYSLKLRDVQERKSEVAAKFIEKNSIEKKLKSQENHISKDKINSAVEHVINGIHSNSKLIKEAREEYVNNEDVFALLAAISDFESAKKVEITCRLVMEEVGTKVNFKTDIINHVKGKFKANIAIIDNKIKDAKDKLSDIAFNIVKNSEEVKRVKAAIAEIKAEIENIETDINKINEDIRIKETDIRAYKEQKIKMTRSYFNDGEYVERLSEIDLNGVKIFKQYYGALIQIDQLGKHNDEYSIIFDKLKQSLLDSKIGNILNLKIIPVYSYTELINFENFTITK